MSYKLIAIDLDDTLLNSAGIIPGELSAQCRLLPPEALVVLCTGRTKRHAAILTSWVLIR